MKILILGATGRTGRLLVNLALQSGHEVIAFVRNPENLQPQAHLTLVRGQLDEVEKMKVAAKDCEVALVALSLSHETRHESLMPIAAASLSQTGIKRVIWLSALGVGSTLENTQFPYRFAAENFLKVPFADYEKGEAILRNSGVNWTTIHPGNLGAASHAPKFVPASPEIKCSGFPASVDRRAIASYMLGIIEQSSTFGQKILLN